VCETELQVGRGAVVGGHGVPVFVHPPRRDVMQTLTELGAKANKGSCRLSCYQANGLRCEAKEMEQ